MRKIIAAINMTLDGYCDHTTTIATDELHQHYNELLAGADDMVYGRITFELMESYWPGVVTNPTGKKQTDEFGLLIDNISKTLFSNTMKKVEWKNSRLATKDLREEIRAIKQKNGKDILIGSPSLIVQSLNLGLVDELQICIQPIIAGKGLALFTKIEDQIDLKFVKQKIIETAGSVVVYYEPAKK